jgi:hypothetical protein
VPVGQEGLAKPRPDQLGERNPVRQARGQRDGVRAHQAGGAAAVLAPVDEDFAQAAVVALVGGEKEPFRADGHDRGVSAAPLRHAPLNARSHDHHFPRNCV